MTTTDDTTTFTVPFMAHEHYASAAGILATEDVRFRHLARLMEETGHTLDDVPDVHKAGPLPAWCWYVLTVNNITPELNAIGEPQSLAHYGFDLSMSSSGVRRWVFFLA